MARGDALRSGAPVGKAEKLEALGEDRWGGKARCTGGAAAVERRGGWERGLRRRAGGWDINRSWPGRRLGRPQEKREGVADTARGSGSGHRGLLGTSLGRGTGGGAGLDEDA